MIAVGLDREAKTMRTERRRFVCAVSFAVALGAAPASARALELAVGVSVGGILAGTALRPAVSPHAGISWRTEGGFLFSVHELLSILPPINKDGAGVYSYTSCALGYASDDWSVDVGPSLSIYSMSACGVAFCGRIAGISPGGYAQATVYLTGPIGVALSANLGWVGGESIVLHRGLAAMVVAGPVVRWSSK
ncbi:MAG: hypothetical protein ABI193_05320 [Minicystis sp.]